MARHTAHRPGRPGEGLFASQVTVCKLRDEHTITTVESAFGLDSAID